MTVFIQFEVSELPGKIPRPFQSSDFGNVYGRPVGCQIRDMVSNVLQNEAVQEWNGTPPENHEENLAISQMAAAANVNVEEYVF